MRSLFLNESIYNNIVFSEVDYLNFCQACNIRPEKIDSNILDNHNYVARKNILGPCVFHPRTIILGKINYNISKIINDLQLSKQNISTEEKMRKIINYVSLVN